jgi:nicotinate phosphoribosyltransferase
MSRSIEESRVQRSTVTCLVYERPSIHQMRGVAQSEMGRFYSGVKRLLNPHVYPVGLELGLYEFKSQLVHEARKKEIENGISD